ncbi:MAG: ATP-binding protein [Alphaproteobacteria bacterium]
MSFRLKTALAIVGIDIVLVAVLLVSGHWHLRRTNDEQLAARGTAASQMMAIMAADAVAALDLASLDAMVAHALKDEQVVYVRVHNADGLALAAKGDAAALAAPFRQDQALADAHADSRFDTRAPIQVGDVVIGDVELGLSTALLEASLRSSLRSSLKLAVLEVLLVAVLGYGFGWLLTRQIDALRVGAERIRQGEVGYQLDIRGRDELAEAARCFNAMSSTLRDNQQALAEQQADLERLALVARAIDEGVMILGRNSVIEWANPAAERLTGYRLDELVGASAPGLLRADRGCAQASCDRFAKLAAGQSLRLDVCWRTKDKRLVWVDLGVTPILDEAGEVVRLIAVQRDVTEQRRMTEELDRHRHHLKALVDEQTTELAEKTRQLEAALEAEKSLNDLQRSFVSMASHEFRTPLAIIDGVARRLGRHGTTLTAEDMTGHVRKVHNAVTRMTRLIESTLAAARMDAGQIVIEPVDSDIGAIVRSCCERQQELSPEHDIHLEITGLPDVIRADPSALDQIFTNLLSNAVKYAPDDPLINVRAWREADDVLVSVRDHGLGMDEEDLGKLFQRFFRAKTSTGITGTGIGLNLIRTLIDRHEGEIGVTSGLGEGTEFTVRLPIEGTLRSELPDVRPERTASEAAL